MSTEIDTHSASIAKLNAQVTNLQKASKANVTELNARVAALTNENKSHRVCVSNMQKKINKLNYDIGFFITHLDLANAGFRVFDCRHTSYKVIPKGESTARKHDAESIAAEYFNDWKKDVEFIKEYKDARVKLVDHHHKHQQAGECQACTAHTIKTELQRVDKSRGVEVKYA
jgi:hypothetical protein